MVCTILFMMPIRTQTAGEETKDALKVKELHEEFKQLDLNGDGYIDANELRTYIAGITEDDITSIFDRFDNERDGVLTFEEYMTLISFQESQNKT